MGAYLYYKLSNKELATEANEFLENNTQNKSLKDEGIFFSSKEDVLWAESNNPQSVDYFKNRIGSGDIKTSGVDCRTNISIEDVLETQTLVFEALNEIFDVKYYAHSCAFSEEEHYFSIEQMKRITNNGALLSGKSSKSEHVVELYNKYYKLLSEPKIEPFDISIVKNKDSVFIDGIWREVEATYRGELRVQYGPNSYSYTSINELVEKIEGHRKYVPKIRYGGAVSDIEAYVTDKDGTLVYLETIGTENMVKSITSVLMQGRMKMNDHTIDASFGYFTINKAGNKRKMVALDDGLAHAILYHSPSISNNNFDVLIGRDKDELLESFSAWLEKSQPLPYPKELTKQLYTKLQERDKLTELNSLNIEAIQVELSILGEECSDLQQIILEVCKENGLISLDAKPIKQEAPLPKSDYLTVGQVERIIKTLNRMPKTYELEDVDIKPIGLKLFSPNMTLYITEADRGCESDEYSNMHTECFGYIKNELDPQCSEWGYINIPYYLEMNIPVRSNVNGLSVGFEQDLHFEDMYIDSRGNVGSLEELENLNKRVA